MVMLASLLSIVEKRCLDVKSLILRADSVIGDLSQKYHLMCFLVNCFRRQKDTQRTREREGGGLSLPRGSQHRGRVHSAGPPGGGRMRGLSPLPFNLCGRRKSRAGPRTWTLALQCHLPAFARVNAHSSCHILFEIKKKKFFSALLLERA